MSDTSIADFHTSRITIITAAARSDYQLTEHTARSWSIEALYNDGKRQYRTEAGARGFMLTAATRRDRTAVQARIAAWAASMVWYCLRNRKPSTPPAAPAQTATLRTMQGMMAATGQPTPYRAHQALLAEWLAKHPDPKCQPAPEPRPFAPAVPIAETLAKVESERRRYVLTAEDRRKAGRSTASKPAPAGARCPHCDKPSDGYRWHMEWAGHIGLCSFAAKYTQGDTKAAGELLSKWGCWATDAAPWNGAFQHPLAA